MTDEPIAGDRNLISGPLIAFNESVLGSSGVRPMALLIRSLDNQKVVGGLWARTSFQWLFVELLFVPEELRGKGLGADMLGAAEGEAIRRGCRGAWLETLSADACLFYQRMGYEPFGSLDDFPPGNTRTFLCKRLQLVSEVDVDTPVAGVV